MLPLDGAYIFNSHLVMLHIQDRALSEYIYIYIFFLNIYIYFFIVTSVFKQCQFYLSNDESSTWLVCHDSNYIDIWGEPARKGKGQKNGNFTLYILGSLDHLYILVCWKLSCVSSIWEISPRAENDPIKLGFFCFTADFFSPSFYCGNCSKLFI